MIAIDTNVLLRYLVQDDADQFALARNFLEEELSPRQQGFVSLVVVCEIAWALDRTYGFSREAIAAAVGGLASTLQLEVEAVDIVRSVADQTECSIADALIHQIGQARNCAKTITFDRKFARMDGVELLA